MARNPESKTVLDSHIRGDSFILYISAVHAKDKSLKDFKETRVVVVGGGYGGIAAAKKLKDNCKLTLIDARDAFHHNMGAQRSSVEAGALRVFFIV